MGPLDITCRSKAALHTRQAPQLEKRVPVQTQAMATQAISKSPVPNQTFYCYYKPALL